MGTTLGGRRTSLSKTGSDRPKALAVSRRKRDQRPVRAGGRKGQAGPCRGVRPGRGPASSRQASPLRGRCRWLCSPRRLPERGDEPERSSSSVRRFEAKTEVAVAARASGGYRVRRHRCRRPHGSARPRGETEAAAAGLVCLVCPKESTEHDRGGPQGALPRWPAWTLCKRGGGAVSGSW